MSSGFGVDGDGGLVGFGDGPGDPVGTGADGELRGSGYTLSGDSLSGDSLGGSGDALR